MRRRQPRNPHRNIIANPLEASKSGTSVPVIDLTGDDDEERAPEVASTSQHVTPEELRRVFAEHVRQTRHRYTAYQHYLRHPQGYHQTQRPYHHHLRNPYQQTSLPLWGMPSTPPRPHRTNAPSHPPTRTKPPTHPSTHVQNAPPPAPIPSNQTNANPPRRWTNAEDALLARLLHQIPTPYHLVEPLLPHRTRCAIIQRMALLRSEQRQRAQEWQNLRELGREALRARELMTKSTNNRQPADTIREKQDTPQKPSPQVEHRTETETAADKSVVLGDSSDDDGLVGERRLAELLRCESSDDEDVKEKRVTEDKLETEELEFVFVAPKRDQQPCQKNENMLRGDFCDPSERCSDDLQPRKRENDTVYDQDKKRVKKDERVVVRGV